MVNGTLYARFNVNKKRLYVSHRKYLHKYILHLCSASSVQGKSLVFLLNAGFSSVDQYLKRLVETHDKKQS